MANKEILYILGYKDMHDTGLIHSTGSSKSEAEEEAENYLENTPHKITEKGIDPYHELKLTKCGICKKGFEGHGHSGLPIIKSRVCEKCNEDKVVKARIYGDH